MIGYNYICHGHKNSKSIHAEVSAISSYSPGPKEIRKGVCLVSLRFSKDGSLRNAKPCQNCVKFINKLNNARGYSIHYIIYSTEEGLVKISLKDLVMSIGKCYVSSGTSTKVWSKN